MLQRHLPAAGVCQRELTNAYFHPQAAFDHKARRPPSSIRGRVATHAAAALARHGHWGVRRCPGNSQQSSFTKCRDQKLANAYVHPQAAFDPKTQAPLLDSRPCCNACSLREHPVFAALVSPTVGESDNRKSVCSRGLQCMPQQHLRATKAGEFEGTQGIPGCLVSPNPGRGRQLTDAYVHPQAKRPNDP